MILVAIALLLNHGWLVQANPDSCGEKVGYFWILLDIVGRRWDIVGRRWNIGEYCGEKVEYCWILWGKGGILRDIFVVFSDKKDKKKWQHVILRIDYHEKLGY